MQTNGSGKKIHVFADKHLLNLLKLLLFHHTANKERPYTAACPWLIGFVGEGPPHCLIRSLQQKVDVHQLEKRRSRRVKS